MIMEIFILIGSDGVEREFVRIVNGDTETSMLKSIYDEMMANQKVVERSK